MSAFGGRSGRALNGYLLCKHSSNLQLLASIQTSFSADLPYEIAIPPNDPNILSYTRNLIISVLKHENSLLLWQDLNIDCFLHHPPRCPRSRRNCTSQMRSRRSKATINGSSQDVLIPGKVAPGICPNWRRVPRESGSQIVRFVFINVGGEGAVKLWRKRRAVSLDKTRDGRGGQGGSEGSFRKRGLGPRLGTYILRAA